jgi:hypothetical protein
MNVLFEFLFKEIFFTIKHYNVIAEIILKEKSYECGI